MHHMIHIRKGSLLMRIFLGGASCVNKVIREKYKDLQVPPHLHLITSEPLPSHR